MSAKNKLNAANGLGVLLVAGLAGGVTGSWSVFCVAAAALYAAACASGDIRR